MVWDSDGNELLGLGDGDRPGDHPADEWSAVERKAFEIRRAQGVIARPYGHNLVLCPPLVITEQQARRAVNALLDVVSRLGTDGTIAAR